MKLLVRCAALLLALSLAGPQSFAQGLAQGYPNKAVTVIVSFSAGSSTDVVGRIVAGKLSEYWGQPVVVENRAGAGGSIGSAVLTRAAPDGYTLLVNSAAHTINPAMIAKLPYDTARDFTEISPLVVQPNVLVVAADSPYKTLADLIAYAKANPAALNIGHGGLGSGTHLNTEKMLTAAGVTATLVPFKGTPEIVQAIFSGSVCCYWLPITAGIGNIRAGRLRPLAVSTPKRSPMLPNVPTTGEAGVPNADTPLWFGLWGPGGMPAALVNKISADVRKVLADPTVRERLNNLGGDAMDMSPEEFSRYVRAEIIENRRVLSAAGVKPE